MGWGLVWPALICGLLVFCWTLNLGWRWRCRHIPGPRPSWLVGNFLDFDIGRVTEALQNWTSTYGSLFVWFMGRKPCIVLSDPDLIRQASVNLFPKLHDRSLFPIIPGAPIEADFLRAGLFSSEGKNWAHKRAVLQQFFTSKELAKHSQKMNFGANRIVEIIDTVASDGTVFEAIDALSRMTLEVIGTAAFGVDFQIQRKDEVENSKPDSSNSFITQPATLSGAPDLLAAGRVLFRNHRIRGIGARIGLGFAPLFTWLQRRGLTLGDRVSAFRNLCYARCFIWGVLQAILEHNFGIESVANSTTIKNAPKSVTPAGSLSKTSGDISPERSTCTSQQCPMRQLGTLRAKCFANGKQNFSTLVSESPPLFNLLHNVINPQTKKPLTYFDLCAQGFNMVLAGYETTALSISYTLYELAKQPELQRRIAQEVAALRALQNQKQSADSQDVNTSREILFSDLKQLLFTEAAFLEGLRLWPPVAPTIPLTRHVKEEVVFNGYRVPKGACVMFNVWSVHHNPKYYANPYDFTPERFLPNHPEMKTRDPSSFLPFGIGPRQCIGKAFALAEGVITIAKLIEKYEFRVDNTRSATLDVVSSVTVQPVNGIWLKAFDRKPDEN